MILTIAWPDNIILEFIMLWKLYLPITSKIFSKGRSRQESKQIVWSYFISKLINFLDLFWGSLLWLWGQLLSFLFICWYIGAAGWGTFQFSASYPTLIGGLSGSVSNSVTHPLIEDATHSLNTGSYCPPGTRFGRKIMAFPDKLLFFQMHL